MVTNVILTILNSWRNLMPLSQWTPLHWKNGAQRELSGISKPITAVLVPHKSYIRQFSEQFLHVKSTRSNTFARSSTHTLFPLRSDLIYCHSDRSNAITAIAYLAYVENTFLEMSIIFSIKNITFVGALCID